MCGAGRRPGGPPSTPPSIFTLTGLVQHLAEVERNWFHRVFAGEQAPPIYDPQAGVLESVDRGLVALVDGRHGSRDQLQHAVDLLTDSLLSHLAWEERILLRPLARYSFY